MALTPTEREEHFFKAMVDAADGSTPEELEPTERKEHWYKEIIDAIKAGGGGSGGGVLVVTGTNGTLDKTWQEIHDADFAVVVIATQNLVRKDPVIVTNDARGEYTVVTGYAEEGYTYIASSASGYPTLSE